MGKFVKRPIMIEARCFDMVDIQQQEELAEWCNGRLRGTKLAYSDRVIQIDTLEGEIEASHGDWIIKGVKGEFYPCKPDIFEMTYGKVDDGVKSSEGFIHKLEDGTPDRRPMLDEDLVAFLGIAANFFDNLTKSYLSNESRLGRKMTEQLSQVTRLVHRLGEEHRTMYIPYGQMVQNLFKTMGSDAASLMHATVGVSGEAGELLDATKKHWVYNKPLDAENVLEELGDLTFYMQAVLNMFGWTWADVRMANRMKLAKRYPDGVYTDTHAQARLDKEGEQNG